MSTSNTTAIPLCVYSVSGWYGPIPRYLFYAILVFFTFSRRISWLVGAAMVYSCTAAIHGCALAAGRGRGVVDLDVVPIFAIVGIGLIVIFNILFWSKTVRSGPAGRLLFICMLLLLAGLIASTLSLKAVPKTSQCGLTWIPESPSCTKTCQNITLPMRDRQTTIPFVVSWRSLLYDFSGWSALYSSILVLLGYYAFSSMPDESPWEHLCRIVGTTTTSYDRRARAVPIARILYGSILLSLVGIPHMIISEFVMSKPKGIPVDANNSTVGQWGILVGAVVGGLGSWLMSTKADSETNEPDEERGPSLLS